jgi:glycosyltransferase involved in cell wall biosynthesis
VSGNVSGNIHKTGLYRVSLEILKNLNKLKLYDIFLYDVFNREREIKKYVQKDFHDCSRIRVCSFWYRILFFPIGNFIDELRLSEQEEKKGISQTFSWVLKNILIIIERVAKKIDKSLFQTINLKTEVNKCDLYYSTYFPIPVPIRLNTKIKKIYTIHDIIPVIHPEHFSSPFNECLVKEVVDNISVDDYVICVSESTKKDLLNYRPELNHDQVVVALLAASENFHKILDEEKINRIKEKYNIPINKDYLLSVCTLEPRKNLDTVLKSLRKLLMKGMLGDLVLVLTGSPGWKSDELIADIDELNEKYNNSIILTGYVTDDELTILYSGAYAFIYLSLYEGFGLPPLEAMKCGVPVIASYGSSLPEVIGDCGILINPTDISELTNAIIRLHGDRNLRNDLGNKSFLRASEFDFCKTVSIIQQTFEMTLK